MKRTILLLALVLTCEFRLIANDPLPFGALGVPVLITHPSGETGSAFFLSISNNIYIATAKHVLVQPDGRFKSDTVKCVSLEHGARTNQVELHLGLAGMSSNNLIRLHPSHDVALIKIGFLRSPGKAIFFSIFVLNATNRIPGITSVGKDMVRKLAAVNEGSDVLVFGYPTSIGLRESPKFDYSRPLLRKGIVAGVNHDSKTIILDSAVYFGNSGGPVM